MAAFGSEDFISFDFGDADSPAANEVENISAINGKDHRQAADDASRSRSRPSSSKGDSSRRTSPPLSRNTGTDTPQSFASTSSKGKKRKFDDDDDEEFGSSMTKKERERAAARRTPWSTNVNWNTARNAAQQ